MPFLSPQVELALAIVLVMLLPFVLIFIWRMLRKRARRLEAEAMMRGNKIYSQWRGGDHRQPLD